jgi:hypothetical protein
VRGFPGKCTYLLPIRRHAFSAAEASEFDNYFQLLRQAECEVVVVDGSDRETFDAHHRVWAGTCRHKTVDSRFGYLNGKVNAIHTGVEAASHEKIILADDDVHYEPDEIASICERLEKFDVVRPQNFIEPLPWWARSEAARMLINRATLRAGDYPGTCAFRRAVMLRDGDYDGDVLFDNEEMIRHFARRGFTIDYNINLLVRKNPPRFRKWLEQRPRQAYEDFALRWKTFFFASIFPVVGFLTLIGNSRTMMAFAAALMVGSMLLAFAGRRRGRAAQVFPYSTCCFAPLWILERAASTYVAFGWRLFRGGYPFGDRILSKGVGGDWVVGGKMISVAMTQSNSE